MATNWKAVLIGAVAFIVLGLVLGYVYSPLAFVGGILGGVIAVWYAKTKDIKNAAVVGLLAGLVAGVVEGVLATTILASVFASIGMAAAVGVIAIVTMAIIGLVLGLVGGVIGSFVVKK